MPDVSMVSAPPLDKKNKIIFDWVSFTSQIDSLQSVISELGLSGIEFQTVSGARGYRQRLYFNGISIHYDGREDMGIWVEMSGQGCRAFETYGTGDYSSLFQYILDNSEQMNLTRLDVAYDDFEGLLDLKKIARDTLAGNFISRFRSWSVNETNKGCTVVHGSPSSDILIRFYDKAKERNRQDVSHWIRGEFQLRDARSLEFVRQLEFGKLIDVLYFEVVNQYLRFVVPDATRLERSSTAKHWKKFAHSVTDGRTVLFVKPGMDYNISNLLAYSVDQAGAAVFTSCEVMGEDEFLKMIRERFSKRKLNPRYEALIAESGRRGNMSLDEVSKQISGENE